MTGPHSARTTDDSAASDAWPATPRYGERSLSDLMPSVLHALGVPVESPALAVPETRRVCILLVDGLGLNLLRRSASHAPFLASLLPDATVLTVGFPTTTVTSLTSFGTGLTPGQHGLTGFEFFLPEIGRPLNGLRWDAAVDGRDLQPLPTMFERAADAGVAVTRIGPRAFARTGFTEAGMRGGVYDGADTPGELVTASFDALRRGDRSLAYVYLGDLDQTGHRRGCATRAWDWQLEHVDRLAGQLASVLPDGGLLLVTGDHGMVDVPAQEQVDLARAPALDDGVRLVTGEPRVSYVHVEDGALADVRSAWTETLGERAWVLTRDEAAAAGWFGPEVAGHVSARIGDLVVAMRTASSVVDSRRMSAGLLSLVGMHGSLTDDEMLVPLLTHAKA